MKISWKRAAIIIVIIAAIVYAAGVAFAGFPPKSEKETVIASYEQKGSFAIQAYDRPKSAGETIFPPIMENLNFSFVYSMEHDKEGVEVSEKTVSVKAVLSELSGAWSKEIPVMGEKKYLSDSMEISFPLDLAHILDIGSAIEKDLDPKYDPQMAFYGNGSYRLDIVATVKDGDKTFEASTGGKLSQSSFVIEDSLNGASRGEGYWDLYAFGYEANIRANALTNASKMSQAAEIIKPAALGQGVPLVLQNMEAVDAVWNYSLTGSHKFENVSITGVITLEGSSPDKWKKVLFTREFSFNEVKGEIMFPIDSDELRSAIAGIDDSIDYRPSPSVDFTVNVDLSVTAKIEGNQITKELSSQSLTGKMEGDKFFWNVGPNKTDSGEMKITERVYPEWFGYCLTAASIILIASLISVIILAVRFWLKRPKPGVILIQCAARKKYDKEIFSESKDTMPEPEQLSGMMIQDLATLDAIAAKAASGDSVNFHEDALHDKVVYWIVVSKTVYRFTAEKE